jgi:Icc protein
MLMRMRQNSIHPRRSLRLALLTDIHLQPERSAPEGLIACLNHVQSLSDRPDLILNGGDAVMDVVCADAQRARLLWDLWDRIVGENCVISMEHCLGNHDLWGYNKKRSGCTGNEPLFGKRWAMERLCLSARYHWFDRAGWRFVVLDSSYIDDAGCFTARLDAEQIEWLRATVAATPPAMHVLILSHVPILAGASVFLTGSENEAEKTGDWVVPAQWMHMDARVLSRLFAANGNVRLCLSGHTHLHDRLDYRGTTYLCGGAVSGLWWRAGYWETPPGYLLIDLFEDGGFHHTYVPTGWQPAPSRERA